MTFGTKGSTEDDEVFCDAGMDDIHGTHSTAGIVEHPFGAVRVKTDLGRWVGGGKVFDDVVCHEGGIAGCWGMGYGGLCEFMEAGRVEDVPPFLKEEYASQLMETL